MAYPVQLDIDMNNINIKAAQDAAEKIEKDARKTELIYTDYNGAERKIYIYRSIALEAIKMQETAYKTTGEILQRLQIQETEQKIEELHSMIFTAKTWADLDKAQKFLNGLWVDKIIKTIKDYKDNEDLISLQKAKIRGLLERS